MKSIIWIPVSDYIHSRKKLYVKILLPLLISGIALAITLLYDFGDSDKINSVFSEFVSAQINIVAILISFSIAIITILVTADNANITALKGTPSDPDEYKPIDNAQLSLFQVLLSNIAYNIISEVVYLILLIAIVLVKTVLPLPALKYLSALCLFMILHILLVLLESVAQMYLTFWNRKE